MILHCCQVDDVQTFRCHYGSSNQACPRENSCFSTVHRLPLRELEHQPPPPPLTARAHTHTRALTVDSLLELVIYLLPPPPSPLLNRHVIPLSSEFHVNQRLVAFPSVSKFDDFQFSPTYLSV